MIKKSKDFEEEDKKKREEIEIRNSADNALFAAEKLIKESRDKLEADDVTKIESGIEKVRAAVEGTDTEAIKKDVEELTESVFAASTKMYQKAAAEAEASKAKDGEGTDAGSADENVVDADYEVKDDKKND